jgi:hypothetical protein
MIASNPLGASAQDFNARPSTVGLQLLRNVSFGYETSHRRKRDYGEGASRAERIVYCIETISHGERCMYSLPLSVLFKVDRDPLDLVRRSTTQ